MDILVKNKNRIKKQYVSFLCVFIISSSVIAMFYFPIQVINEIYIDLRLIPLIFIAYKWGWKIAIPVLFITSFWRLVMGEEVVLYAIFFGMVLPVLTGLMFRKFLSNSPELHPINLFWMLIFSWFSCDIPIALITEDGLTVYKEIFVIRFLSLILTGFILNFFITKSEKEYEMREKLQFYAERDPLTGLYNTRFFEMNLQKYHSTEKNKYIIMIDIDHFKLINDTYGHLIGDNMIKNIAEILVEQAKKHPHIDTLIGRYGGEEFIIFAATNDRNEMIQLVEDIHQAIEENIFYTEDRSNQIKLTVSIGVSEFKDNMFLYEAVEKADQSLYKSKKNGRNQIHYA